MQLTSVSCCDIGPLNAYYKSSSQSNEKHSDIFHVRLYSIGFNRLAESYELNYSLDCGRWNGLCNLVPRVSSLLSLLILYTG